MKTFSIHPVLPAAGTAIPAPNLPPVPNRFLDEANHLLNVRLNGPETLMELLTFAYDFLDKFNREFVSTFTSCSKGCSHCCRMDVQVTSLEAEYIVVGTGIHHSPSARFTRGHKTACPFLSDGGECSIYAVRPLFCRTYHALSAPALCGEPGAVIYQYGTMAANMGNRIYEGITSWVHFQNQHATAGFKDIRDFFPHNPAAMHQHLLRYSPRRPS
jgi:hypothetical protein